MEIADSDVVVAHRIGQKTTKKPRVMIAHCSPLLRQSVFQYTSNLKGVRNPLGDFYYVNQHLPEKYASHKKEIRAKIKKNKENNGKSDENKVEIRVKNNVLHLNNELQKKQVAVPTVADLFSNNRS